METNLVVDFRNIRCGSCKVIVRDKMAKQCPTCHAIFTRVSSNHVGLATKLTCERSAGNNGTTTKANITVEPEDLYPDMVGG